MLESNLQIILSLTYHKKNNEDVQKRISSFGKQYDAVSFFNDLFEKHCGIIFLPCHKGYQVLQEMHYEYKH